jgi:hypothetical protein
VPGHQAGIIPENNFSFAKPPNLSSPICGSAFPNRSYNAYWRFSFGSHHLHWTTSRCQRRTTLTINCHPEDAELSTRYLAIRREAALAKMECTVQRLLDAYNQRSIWILGI